MFRSFIPRSSSPSLSRSSHDYHWHRRLFHSSSPTSFVWNHLTGNLTNAKRLDFQSIPIIDIAPFVTPNPSPSSTAYRSSIDALHHACHNIGFFYISNHSISQQLITDTFDELQSFFAQPLSYKNTISCKDTPNRGYFHIGGENLGAKKYGDYKEGIDFGRELSEEEIIERENKVKYAKTEEEKTAAEKEIKMLSLNKYPSSDVLPKFRKIMQKYHEETIRISIALQRALAVSLELPANYFDSIMHRPTASLRVLHYPPQDQETLSDELIGCGPHTDYGMLTILAQNASGLQVQNRAGEWINAPVIDGTFVVNLGDMLPRWTNDYYCSTPHRVLNTRTKQTASIHRYSIPMFYEPRFDAVIETIPKFINANNTPLKYPPVKFGDHLEYLYKHTYQRTETPPLPINENDIIDPIIVNKIKGSTSI